MKTHKLKIFIMFLRAIEEGAKTWIARENDHHFQMGDQILLQEWDEDYTGNELLVKITYISKGPTDGIEDGYCVMSIKKVDDGKDADREVLALIATKVAKPYYGRSECVQKYLADFLDVIRSTDFNLKEGEDEHIGD